MNPQIELLLEAMLETNPDNLITIAVNLAKKDTGENWKLVDDIVDYHISHANHYSIAANLPELLDSENGCIRDLGATYAAKIRPKYSSLSQKKACWDNPIKNRILDMWEVDPETGERDPEAVLPSRGIHDKYSYAQLRAVIAAIEHNWLSNDNMDLAKEVLERHKDEMQDVIEPYLKKLNSE